jgi:hypothetical protein
MRARTTITKSSPAGTAEGCSGLHRGLFPVVPTGLFASRVFTQDCVLGAVPAGLILQSDLQHFPFLIAAHLFHPPDLIVGELLYLLERSLLLIL